MFKGKRKRGKRISKAERDAMRARERFYRWSEHFDTAVKNLIESLAKGGRLSPAKRLVAYAVDLADAAIAASDARRPPSRWDV